MATIQPEKRPGIYKYSTETGATWNGYKVDLKCTEKKENGDSILHRFYETFPISRHRSSWRLAGRATLTYWKAATAAIEELRARCSTPTPQSSIITRNTPNS